MLHRPSWDEFFLGMAEYNSTMSTCTRLRVGAVIVRDKRPLTLGFNGAPSGYPHCTEAGCLQDPENSGCLRTDHAEMNAVMQADQYTINLQGTTIYITHSPCRTCAEMLIRRGIKRVVYREEYRIKEPIELLRRMQVEVVHMPKKEGIQ